MDWLTEKYQADDIQPTAIKSGGYQNKAGHKTRYMFKVNDAEKAYEIYDSITQQKFFLDTDQRMQIYFLKPEKAFEDYADEEAEVYYAEQKQQQEQQRDNRQNNRN